MEAFKNYGLRDEILKSIGEMGFITPTSIQEKIIPAIMKTRKDLIGLAQTGTGKTAGFGLPIIQQIDIDNKSVQAIILCPTRELCLQITKDLGNYTKHITNINIAAVYGGASIETQIRKLKNGSHIVVGTPGRTLDLIKRKVLKINNIRWLVLDEADEMLNMGFREELDAILESTPGEKQTLLFSATMPKGVRLIANKYMINPEELTAGKKNAVASNVSHQFYMVKAIHKYLALKRIVDINPNIYGIVFCRTRNETRDIANKLIQDGYIADALHGDLSQVQRDQVMDRFRMKHLKLLVATDVAARGIDVTDLTHIINYNLPDDSEVYIHRSGRTARAGKFGVCISIIHSRENNKLKTISRLIGKEIKQMQVPDGRTICEKRLYNLIDKVESVSFDDTQIESFMPEIYKKLEWLDRNELLKRFVAVEFNRFLDYYKNAEDINIDYSGSNTDKRKDKYSGKKTEKYDDKRKETFAGKKRSSITDFVRFHINIGSKQKLTTTNLIGLINERTRTRNIEIGKIEILKNFSFFEIDKTYENLLPKSFQGASFDNVNLTVERSKPVTDNRNTLNSNKKGNNDWDRRKKKWKKQSGRMQ
ncbi:DEAD/DEAH box helicase [candidate division KSB1 bacterium]